MRGVLLFSKASPLASTGEFKILSLGGLEFFGGEEESSISGDLSGDSGDCSLPNRALRFFFCACWNGESFEGAPFVPVSSTKSPPSTVYHNH